MNEYLKEEYLMLREETQTNLKAQKDWSLFSITTTVTILGFAINANDAEYSAGLCCIPFVILFVAATKVKNYKESCLKIAGYMITRIETNSAFFWETCLNEYRRTHTNTVVGTIEILEFTLTGAVCFMLYYSFAMRVRCNNILGCNKYLLLIVLFAILIIIFKFSENYWNVKPSDIEREYKDWSSIIENCTNKEKEKCTNEKCIDEEK